MPKFTLTAVSRPQRTVSASGWAAHIDHICHELGLVCPGFDAAAHREDIDYGELLHLATADRNLEACILLYANHGTVVAFDC